MRHGIEGFLVPTLLGPAGGGLGARMVERHTIEAQTYQAYVGGVAQHTAVHIGKAAEALAQLIASPDLRRTMGAAGRRRVAEAFDWPVVARQIHDLTDDLAQVRAASADPVPRPPSDPVKGDPFRDFAGFATTTLTLDTRLWPAPGVTREAVLAKGSVPLDMAFPALRAQPDLCARAFDVIAAQPGTAVREVLVAFEAPQRRAVELGLAWMAKYGLVDWLG
ncbi:glycosyltransferase [Phenylobacterium sp.]|uniref:glycosyltransferase n=1 Tax=Phenylobacterium sp. TaxID=1871053 RepID=UPI003D2674F4